MNSKSASLAFLVAISLLPQAASGFTATIEIAIGQLRDSGGSIVSGNSTWALIVSNSGGLPGGLTDGGSIGSIPQIVGDFNGVSLTPGDKGSYTVLYTDIIDGADLGFPGTAFGGVSFPFPGPYIPGTLFGIYWFPNKSPGTTLTGSFEVGGFAQSISNPQSGGTSGTIIPQPAEQQYAYFFETNFNANEMMQGSSGLGAERFTAVAVPEISSVTLAALGLNFLLIRRRR